jgi:hypothetical protein
MKFKFTKKWCEQAAKTENGISGLAGCLMACNPKYLKENQVKTAKLTKLTKEQKDFIQGKIRKVKGLAEVIKQQKLFIEQVNLTLTFLQAYEGNPDSFPLLIGNDVWEHYKFEECYAANNPEFMWECIDEMTCDIVYKNKNFTVVGNGIFVSLHFSKKKNDKKFKENFKYLLQYGDGGEWHI